MNRAAAMVRATMLVATAAALAACSLAPTYERPAPAIPARWPTGDADVVDAEPTVDPTAQPTLDYRDLFRDARLVRLIERALANNQDLRVAIANIDIARGQLRVQRAALFPQVDASAGVTRGRSGVSSAAASSATGIVSGNRLRTTYEADVGLSAFEIDLFGRVRNLTEAAANELLGTEAAARSTRLSLAAEVANAWVAIAADESLLAIARDTEGIASRSVELTRARLEGGIAPRTDVRQAETILATARSDRAGLVTQVAQDRNALERLVGGSVAPDETIASIETADRSLERLPSGIDSQVLLRRPDIAQAEYQLVAANARIGAARAAYFPTISLTAVAGVASTALSSLWRGDAFTWSVGPAVSLPLFDAGRRRGNVEISEASRDAAVAQYQVAIQTAFREVADALARRGTIDTQVDAQVALESAATDTVALADARYREGIDSFLASLDAQRTQYAARRTLVTARRLRAENTIELYRALGGETQ